LEMSGNGVLTGLVRIIRLWKSTKILKARHGVLISACEVGHTCAMSHTAIGIELQQGVPTHLIVQLVT